MGSTGRRNNKATIDRIDPKLGYIKGNVRLVTYHVNVARWEYGDAELVELARSVLATAQSKASGDK